MTVNNELSKLDLNSLVLTEEAIDSTESYSIRLLYALDIQTYILIKDLETNEINSIHFNTKNITITDLYNQYNEDNPSIKYLEVLINHGINKSGTSTLAIEEEVHEITNSLINSLYEMSYEEAYEEKRNVFLKALEDEKLKEKILKVNDRLESKALNKELEYIKKALKREEQGITKAIQQLGNYLNKVEGVILRKTTNDIYKLDRVTNAYKHITIDELMEEMAILFNEKNVINDKDLDKAIHYITDRLEPETNIVKFNNCIYSMKEHDIIESEEPVFTIIECPYNYNPEAKSVYAKKFLYDSLEVKGNPEETELKVKGVYQIIG